MSTSGDSWQRIEPVDTNCLNEDQADLLSNAATAYGKPLDIYLTLARCPGLLRRVMGLGGFFQSCLIPAVDREIVILTVANECGSAYLSFERCDSAKRAGLTSDQIDSLYSAKVDSRLWTTQQYSLMKFTKELLSDDDVSDEVWSSISSHDNFEYMTQLIVLIGFYRTIATFINVARIELTDFQ